MTDKNGKTINVGDHIVPDEGMELVVTAQGKVPEYEDEEVLVGYQVEHITCFSVLTQENLSSQWRVKE
jgi:hypothetical protein